MEKKESEKRYSAQHLMPLNISNIEEYGWHIREIDSTITGLVDSMFANSFISESCYLLKNSLLLIEQGFYDASYYSLRQALELSLTMCFLVEQDKEKQQELFDNWKSEERFPPFNQMSKKLDDYKKNYHEIKNAFKDLFDSIESVKNKVNKVVHKQGFDKFYTFLFVDRRKNGLTEKLTNQYVECLEKIIAVIAVMRLIIDPFPILLADEEIYHRTGDLLTESFSDEFIGKYFDKKELELYKQTEMFVGYRESLMNCEKQCDAVSNLRKYNIVDCKCFDQITKQMDLLTIDEKIVVLSCMRVEKIVAVYNYSALFPYMTDRYNHKDSFSVSSKDFEKFKCSAQRYNQEYKGHDSLISYFVLDSCVLKQDYFMEHYEELEKDEIAAIQVLIVEFVDRINEECADIEDIVKAVNND